MEVCMWPAIDTHFRSVVAISSIASLLLNRLSVFTIRVATSRLPIASETQVCSEYTCTLCVHDINLSMKGFILNQDMEWLNYVVTDSWATPSSMWQGSIVCIGSQACVEFVPTI